MVHRGKRSQEAKIRRYAKRYVLNHSFHDVIWAETICIFDRVAVHNYIHVTYPELLDGVLLSDIPDIERGEVLVDSRGRGSFQR